MQDVRRTLSEFKIRASYGQLGNQNIGSNYPTIQQLDVSSISVNDVITPIVTQTTLANPDITWESTEMYDVGIDATLFDKLSVTADWYYRKTHDILSTLDIPSIIGLGAPDQNAGTVRNVGWEVAVGYHNKWRDFSFGVEANLSDVVNKIIDMKGTTGGSGAIRNQEGIGHQLDLRAQMRGNGPHAGGGRLGERGLSAVRRDDQARRSDLCRYG